MEIVPPYMNKLIEKYELEVLHAEKKEIRAKKNYEFAQEYTKLCKEKLEKAKQDEANKQNKA